MQGDWITMSTLGTFGGVVFVVTLIAQFLKGLTDRIAKFPTRFLVLGVSWLILFGHRYVTTGALAFDGIFLDFLNGFLVTLTAMGAHAVAKDNLRWK